MRQKDGYMFPRGRSGEEHGIAMVTAVMVTMVVTILGLVSLRMSLHSADSTASNRKRVQAVGAAEAGLDFALARIQKPVFGFPCALTDTLQTSPTLARYSAKITYFDGYPTGTPLACTATDPPVLAAGTPKGALIVSRGTTNAKAFGDRTMEALVRLEPLAGGVGFDKAIFSDSSISVANNTDVYGENGPDGDVYTNGDFVCDVGNQNYRGNITAAGAKTGTTGSISFLQKCTVEGDLYGRGHVKTTNNALIAHDIKTSQGNITLSNSTEVRHDAIAGGTINGGIVRNNRKAGASLPDPPVQALPTLNYDETAWTTKGYVATVNNDCATVNSDIVSKAAAGAPRLIRTACPVTLDMKLKLNNDLAIFADGGFVMQNNFDLLSVNSTVRDMHFIVPSSAATAPCVTPGITTGTGSTFYDTVHYLMFTPCKITLRNANGGYGQIYGGTVSIENNFTFHYAPMPVFGATTTSPTSTFTLDIAYKREISN